MQLHGGEAAVNQPAPGRICFGLVFPRQPAGRLQQI